MTPSVRVVAMIFGTLVEICRRKVPMEDEFCSRRGTLPRKPSASNKALPLKLRLVPRCPGMTRGTRGTEVSGTCNVGASRSMGVLRSDTWFARSSLICHFHLPLQYS